MTIISRRLRDIRLRIGLPIAATVTLVLAAAAVGGIEWAFASLGMIVLIGMAGISVYTLTKALLRSDTSLESGCPECGRTSAQSFDGDDLRPVTYGELAEARPISEQDEMIIMEHIDEFFKIAQEQSQEKLTRAVPISEQDKRLIMRHIDELFEIGWEQSREKPC